MWFSLALSVCIDNYHFSFVITRSLAGQFPLEADGDYGLDETCHLIFVRHSFGG